MSTASKKLIKTISGSFLCFILAAALPLLTASPCLCADEVSRLSVTERELKNELPAAASREVSRLSVTERELRDDSVVDLLSPDADYTSVVYDNTNGMPTSEANDIAETSEGFIWIGCYSGLVRYDGSNFVRMDSTTGITSVRCLHVDSRDRLWIGTNDSGLFLMENGTFRNWDKADGLKASSVRDIEEDARGTIYVATTGGITIIDPDLTLHTLNEPEIRSAFVNGLVPGDDNRIYGVTNVGNAFILKYGFLERFYAGDEIGGGGANSLCPDPAHPGRIYLEKSDGEFVYGDPEDGFDKMTPLDVSPLNQIQSIDSIGGLMWICARNGVGLLNESGFHYLEHLPMNNSIGHVMRDYAGNLWFTSSRQGVMKVVPNRFTDISEKYDLPENVNNSTCMYGDMLFIGSDSGLDILGANGVVRSFPIKKAATASGDPIDADDLLEMLDGCRIRSIIRDSRDRLWISTWQKYGLVRYDGGVVTSFTAEDGLFSDYVRTVCELSDGSVAAAVTGGVNIIDGDRVTKGYNENIGMENTEILTVAEGYNGDLLVGSDGDGIYIINSSCMRHIGKDEGLTSGAVMRIKYDPGLNICWVITGSSIEYLTDDYSLTTIDTFPYSNNFDLYKNSRDEIWVLNSSGIYVVNAGDMLANENIDPVRFSLSNGLPYIATANSYSALTAEGDLFIAGSSGVAKVNIEDPLNNIGSLKAAIPFVDADGVRIYPDSSGTFSIGSDVKKLTVYGFVFNYSMIDPQISCRLIGFDADTVTVNRSELVPMDYTNLKGGTYLFQMQIKDPVSRQTNTISAHIVKEKAFYEHVWFYVIAVALAAAVLNALIKRYLRRKIVQLEEKNREEAEKERINAELTMANRIQAGILPTDFPAFPDRTEFDVYASMDPAREVGGDFYDFFLTDDDHLCLVMADVSGKGIPAALFMMVAKSLVKNSAMLGQAPADILTKTNETICANNKMEMFVTVWVGILELSTGILTAANAGHEYPALMRSGRKFELFRDKHGFVVGGMDGMVYQEYTLRLQRGDKLFLYTDGVPEATDTEQKLFGTDRMLAALNHDPDVAPEQLLVNVREAVDSFVMGAEQFDDLTMLCVEYRGPDQGPAAS